MKTILLGSNDKAFYALIVHLTFTCETIHDPGMPYKISLINIHISRNKHDEHLEATGSMKIELLTLKKKKTLIQALWKK
jgi:hypothetical protein